MDYAALIIAAGGLITAVSTALKYRADTKTAVQKTDFETLRGTFKVLQATVDELQEQKAEQQKEIRALQVEIETLTRKNKELERAKNVLTRRVTELTTENATLHEHINKLRSELDEYKKNGKRQQLS